MEFFDSDKCLFWDFAGNFSEKVFINVKLDVLLPFENDVDSLKDEKHNFVSGFFLGNRVSFSLSKIS